MGFGDAPLRCSEEDPCWMSEHPVELMFLCFFRSIGGCIDLLCFDLYGKYVLPAYLTLVGRASVFFMSFVVLCIIGSFSTYYMLPINANMVNHDIFSDFNAGNWTELDSDWHPYKFAPLIRAFMKIFRIDIVGDVGIDELQGGSEQLVLTHNLTDHLANKSPFAEIHNSAPNKKYYLGVDVFFIFAVTMLNVMLVNVYIGLLSSVYKDKSKRTHKLLARFRSCYTWTILLRVYFFLDVCHMKRFPLFRNSWNCWRRQRSPPKGLWIAYDKRQFNQELLHEFYTSPPTTEHEREVHDF